MMKNKEHKTAENKKPALFTTTAEDFGNGWRQTLKMKSETIDGSISTTNSKPAFKELPVVLIN